MPARVGRGTVVAGRRGGARVTHRRDEPRDKPRVLWHPETRRADGPSQGVTRKAGRLAGHHSLSVRPVSPSVSLSIFPPVWHRPWERVISYESIDSSYHFFMCDRKKTSD